jgi:RNA polymerase sigma-70 factor (ECF subfamily)
LADPELPALVARAQKGDRAAFEKLVRSTARLVYAHIAATVRDRQKAEDLVQETYVSAWKGIGSVESSGEASGGGFVSWLLTVARNVTLDAAKSASRKKRGSGRAARPIEESGAAAHGPTPAESAEMSEARDHALKVLQELPEEYRAPLMMRYLGGADYQTICRALQLSDGALRGMLNRGMALMRERMGKREHDKVKR